MGVFLQAVIVQKNDVETVRAGIQKVEKGCPDMNIRSLECVYRGNDKGTCVIMNENSAGYEMLASSLSQELHIPVMLLYIYDDDEWGYFYYDGDVQKDSFSVCPREGMEELEPEQLRLEQLKSEQIKPEQPNASAEFIAKQFHINVNEIVNYYRIWTDELIEDEQAAYEDDEYTYGDCWQIADFMRKLGFPFPEGDEPELQRAVEISSRDTQNLQNAAVTQNNIRISSESENGTKSFDYASATAYVGAFDYEYGVILLETYKSRLRDIIVMLECGKYRKAREELTRQIDNVKNNCHSEEERKFLSGLYVLRGSCSRIIGNSWNAGRDLDAAYELEPENIYILR